jgi:hypothetical protein
VVREIGDILRTYFTTENTTTKLDTTTTFKMPVRTSALDAILTGFAIMGRRFHWVKCYELEDDVATTDDSSWKLWTPADEL